MDFWTWSVRSVHYPAQKKLTSRANKPQNNHVCHQMSEVLMTENVPHNAERMWVDRNADKVAVQHSPGRRPKPPQNEDAQVDTNGCDNRCCGWRDLWPHAVIPQWSLIGFRKDIAQAERKKSHRKRREETARLPRKKRVSRLIVIDKDGVQDSIILLYSYAKCPSHCS